MMTLSILAMAGMAQDFKAVPGMDTDTLQVMINEASNRGGGRVTFSQGQYLIGQLVLKNGVELHLEEGACLLGSTSLYDYVAVGATQVAGDLLKDNSCQGLIMAKNVKGIAITVTMFASANTPPLGETIIIRPKMLQDMAEVRAVPPAAERSS